MGRTTGFASAPWAGGNAKSLRTGPWSGAKLIDLYGRRGRFTFATNVRITVNGQTTDPSHLPAGAHALARALRLTPTEISVLDLTR